MLGFMGRWRVMLVLSGLALVVAVTPPEPARQGARLAWALPAAAAVCSLVTGHWIETLVRFAVMEGAVQASKTALGGLPLNQRPDGSGRGFPSAHSAHAGFGAAALVGACLGQHPVAQGAVLLTAGFVGASRVDAGRHDPWQVLAGWAVGAFFARARWRRLRRAPS